MTGIASIPKNIYLPASKIFIILAISNEYGWVGIRSKSEWNDSILLIDRDHCLYTRPREAEGTCPFGMAPSRVSPFVDWPFRDGSFIKGNRLLTNLINYYRNWSLILISS